MTAGNKSKSKSDFSFQLTFAPERKLKDVKLKKTMDKFYGNAPGTTKAIKSKAEKLPDMKDVDDGSTIFPLGTYVYKVLMILDIEAKFKDTICTRNSILLYTMMEIKKIIITMK